VDTPTTRSRLEDHGLRCTRQREAVYAALAATKSHPTAEELHQSIAFEGLSLATVYNTLEALTAAGLARRMPCPSGSGAARYDAQTHEHVHVALCDGRLVDLPPDLSDRMLSGLPRNVLDEIERRLGVRVGGVSVQVVATVPARISAGA
jgi:Fe2+ or Zn2+ uptake regulation protein